MNKGKYLIRLACIFAVFTVLIYVFPLYGSGPDAKEASRTRADVITIDGMTVFGELEKPPVEFLHDAHTEALAKKNLDCKACHSTEKDRMIPKFKRMKDDDRVLVMNVYHKECIACHGEMKVAYEKAGPVDCEGCHKSQLQYASSRQPMGFDLSLHSRHAEANEKKCENCHHEYDEKTKKLFYAKGKEGTCRYCHQDQTIDNRISMRLASHIACINCHSKTLAQKLDSGPVNCAGCHDLAMLQKIKKISPVPRMERKQPDMVLVRTMSEKDKTTAAPATPPNRMDRVPFDHQAHEKYNDTCRVCHHAGLQPCSECHSLTGKKEGKHISLEKAMHQAGADESCLGCHATKQKAPECAGCHAPMGEAAWKEDESCRKCHNTPMPEAQVSLSPEQENVLASEMLKKRKPLTGTYSEKDIPEKVVIGHLSKDYEPVDFPHRKIVSAIFAKIKDNKLAANFHNEEGTLCQGCHHNSPVSKKPPQCGSCHGRVFDKTNPLKPGITGAYHQQCMGCHQEMGIQKPVGCTECHKEKKINKL